MKEQYKALSAFVRFLQLKFESDSDDRVPRVDYKKVATHQKWCSFPSKRLFESLQPGEQYADGEGLPYGDDESESGEEQRGSNEHDNADEEGGGDGDGDGEPNGLDEDLHVWTQRALGQAVAAAIVVLIERTSRIKLDISRDTREEPPTYPIDMVTCSDTKFNTLLESHESKLNEHFGEATTQEIWAQRKKLIHLYKTKTDVRRSIDDASDETFEDAWEKVLVLDRFNVLNAFAVGLASISPGTHTVEGDFSTLKRTKGSFRATLSNYAIEGELQARQYFDLINLANTVDQSEDDAVIA